MEQISYWWTDLDKLVTDADGKKLKDDLRPHMGSYVTPYGLLPNSLFDKNRKGGPASCKQFEPGKPYLIEAKGKSTQPGLLTRFSMPGYKWIDPPKSLLQEAKTLGALFDSLAKLPKTKYPHRLYDKSHKTTTCWLWFDHWENSEYRYRVIKELGEAWLNRYRNSPEELPIKAGSTTISKIVCAPTTPKPKVSSAPHRPATIVIGTAWHIENCIKDIRFHIDELAKNSMTAKRALTKRLEIVAWLKAIHTIGTVCQDPTLPGLVDNVLPHVQKEITNTPIHNKPTLAKFIRPKGTQLQPKGIQLQPKATQLQLNILKVDTRKQAEDHANLLEAKLRNHDAAITQWMNHNSASIQAGNTTEAETAEKYASALGDGIEALAKYAPAGKDPSFLLQHLENAPAVPIKADSKALPIDTVFSIVGKGRSLTSKIAGLQSKMVRAYGLWKFAVELPNLQWASHTQSANIWSPKLEKLVKDMCKHVPADAGLSAKLEKMATSGATEEEMKAFQKDWLKGVAKQEENATAILSRKNVHGEKIGSGMSALSALSFLMTWRSFSQNLGKVQKSPYEVFQFGTSLHSVTTVSLGAAKDVLKSMQHMKDAAKHLADAGTAMSAVGAIFGLVSAGVNWADAYENPTAGKLATAWFGCASAAFGATAAVYAVFAITTPIGAAITVAATILSITSGAISIGTILASLDTRNSSVLVAQKLMEKVLAHEMGDHALRVNSKVDIGFTKLKNFLKDNDMRDAPASWWTIARLQRAGLDRSVCTLIMGGNDVPHDGPDEWIVNDL